MALLGTIKPSTYILAIIVFSFMILSGVSMMAEFRKADPTFMESDQLASFNTTFNTYTRLSTMVTNLQGSVTSSQTDWSIVGALNALIGGAWSGLVLLFNSLGFMNAVFLGLGMFGVPSWVGGLMSFAVIIIIAFAIWSAIFRSEI
jgi:hypothetical protein